MPPGAVLTDDHRAALVLAVADKLGCVEHDHGDLEKAELRKLPHRAPQAWVDETGERYERLMHDMLEEIGAVLEKP